MQRKFRYLLLRCRWAVIAAAGILLAGCASEPRTLVYSPPEASNQPRVTWPSAADGQTPRYAFVGELVGEENLVITDEENKNALKSLLKWIVGLGSAREPYVGLSRPQSGAVHGDGRILVADFGRASVFVFDPKAGTMQEWRNADPGRLFITPVAIAVGPEGRIFVTDSEHAFVARLDREGNPLPPLGEGQLTRPTGLAYEAETGRLYVTDTHAHHVKIFDLEGRLLDVWGDRGEDADLPPGRPRDVSDLMFNLPTHLAVAKGKLYVSDTMNARIQVISTETGKLLRSVGMRGTYVGNLVRPKGVAVDSDENVYVVEGYHDHLLIFDKSGRYLLPIGGEGDAPGQFRLPTGIWIDQDNRVFVADSQNARVQIFQYLGGQSPARAPAP